jgi:diguanylate cyclase (GGDEF)-like protein/PAS domain S-box-containing protein
MKPSTTGPLPEPARSAEDALKDAQSSGRLADVGGWQLELAGERRIHWTQTVADIHEAPLGYAPTLDEALAFIDPSHQPRLTAALEEGLRTGRRWQVEVPARTARGNRRWVRIVGDTQYDAQGEPMRVVGALQDITERKAAENALRELTDIFDNTPDFVVQTDWKGRVIYMNPAVRRAVGFGPDEDVTSHSFGEFYTPDSNQLLVEVATPFARRHGAWVGETRAILAGGRVLPINHMVMSHKDADGRVSRYSSVMRDISQQVQARDFLHRQTQTLSSIAEAIPAIIGSVGPDETYRFVNSAFERWRGIPRDEIIGKRIRDELGEQEYAASAPNIHRAMRGEMVSFERDSVVDGAQRHQLVTYIPLRLPGGELDGFVGVAQDITVHKQEKLRLLRLSQSDPLTGLLNRKGLETYLEQGHGAGADGMALLYIDLDRFKPVNDTYGHPMGDALLQAFAERLRKLVRPTDVVARLGGDEFALVLPGIRTQANADAVADKVVAAAGMPFRLGQQELRIGASVGVAMAGDDGWDGLVQRADAAVYRAKAAGRGRRA